MKFQEFDGIKFYESKQGYYVAHINGKIKRMHIYVWEKYNGKIPKGYHIHHIDFNKANNDISNLQMLTIKEHNQLHNTEERKSQSRQNIKKAIAAAVYWHKSEDGKEWHKEHWKKSIGNKLEKTETKYCQWCGNEYNVSKSNFNRSRFCCASCRHKSLMADYKKEGKICQKSKALCI